MYIDKHVMYIHVEGLVVVGVRWHADVTWADARQISDARMHRQVH